MGSTRNIVIRRYEKGDSKYLAEIYYHTIHNICSNDYSHQQINAWAPKSSLDPSSSMQKWEKILPFVATIDKKIVGFLEFENNGHIDCFYCHHKFTHIGIGKKLLETVEEFANQNNIKRLYAEVSITARPFFEKQDFTLVKQQSVKLGDQKLTNFVMEKYL